MALQKMHMVREKNQRVSKHINKDFSNSKGKQNETKRKKKSEEHKKATEQLQKVKHVTPGEETML